MASYDMDYRAVRQHLNAVGIGVYPRPNGEYAVNPIGACRKFEQHASNLGEAHMMGLSMLGKGKPNVR